MCPRVDDPALTLLGHKKSSFWVEFERSQHSLHGGVTCVGKAPLVWRWRPFLLFFLISPPPPPMQNFRAVFAIYFSFTFVLYLFYHYFLILNKPWNYKCFPISPFYYFLSINNLSNFNFFFNSPLLFFYHLNLILLLLVAIVFVVVFSFVSFLLIFFHDFILQNYIFLKFKLLNWA